MLAKALRAIVAVSACLMILAGCQTTSLYSQAGDAVTEIEGLAAKGKCGKAIQLYDDFKVKFRNESYTPTRVAWMATNSQYGKKTPSSCLLENGRHQEIISQFEMTCLSLESEVSAHRKSLICSPDSYPFNTAAAYKSAGRTNPLAADSQRAAEIQANAEYSSRLDAAVGDVYVRLVTASGEVGTPAGALRYHQQMKEASRQALVFIDEEIAKYANHPERLRALNDKRRIVQADFIQHGGEITELQKSREEAERSRNATSGILDAAEIVLAGTQGGAQFGSDRFPNDIEYVNGPGLEANSYYKPLGCVVWTPREKPAGHYDTQNNCRYDVDVYYKQGQYQPDYVYSSPRHGIRARSAGGKSFTSDKLGALIACLEADSLLKRRKGDLEGVPDYEGHICRRRGQVTHHGTGQTAQ